MEVIIGQSEDCSGRSVSSARSPERVVAAQRGDPRKSARRIALRAQQRALLERQLQAVPAQINSRGL